MPITQVLLTTSAVAAPPPPPPTPDGQYLAEDGAVNWLSVSQNKPGYNTNYSFPDNQTVGTVWNFNGVNNWMVTQNHIAFNQMYINMWFYPTASGRIILTIQDTLVENTSYHHATLEINSNNTVSAGFWNGSIITSVTSANTVTLNTWNHVYFRQSSNQILLQVNGGTAVTINNVWNKPAGALYIGIGTFSVTAMGNSGRYAGYLAEFRMNSTNTANNYMETRSRYEAPQEFIYDDFTIEWWQKAESIGVNSRPWAIGLLGSASGQEVSISYEGNGRDYFWINNSFPAQLADRPLKNHYGIGWEHMAIVRKDNVIKLFSNGTSYLTWSGGNQAITALNADLVVGTGEIPNGNFQGNITDLHIIKGYAKYTSNFTPPTSPIQAQTGSVFLLPATASGGAYDDVISYKSATISNTPTWSVDNPYQFPTQTFTVFAYDTYRIVLNAALQYRDLEIGLKVSDTQGWSDYIIDIPAPNHADFANPVPARAPGEVYTIEEAAISAFSNVGNGDVIDFGSGNYWKALEVIKAGWTVSQGGPTLATVTSVQTNLAPNYIRVNVTPNIGAVYGTYTFTPPASSGSIRFDAGDRINYGSSVDWAFDVDAIASGSITLNLDANDTASYSGTGSAWTDLSGNSNNATLINSPYWDNGPPGYFNFNGVNQYATAAGANIIPQSAYTKMVWFKINTFSADNNLVSSDNGGHFMYFNQTNTLYAGHSNVLPYNAFGSSMTFATDTWYCAVVTFSVANGIKLYVNGVLDASDPSFQTPHNQNGNTNIACFGIGGNLLNGKIGRILCYGRELTSGEVLQNFNATRNRYGI